MRESTVQLSLAHGAGSGCLDSEAPCAMTEPPVLLGRADQEGVAQKHQPFTRYSKLFKDSTSKVGDYEYREADAEALAKVPLDEYKKQSFNNAPWMKVLQDYDGPLKLTPYLPAWGIGIDKKSKSKYY